MTRPFNIPIEIIKRDEETERWEETGKLAHAKINENYRRTGLETVEAGGIQIIRSFIFEFRYSKELAKIAYDMQLYGIRYQGHNFNIVNYDNFQERNQIIKLTGALW